MTEQSPSPQKANPHDFLWPHWLRSQEWRQSLERKATHKALDIPDDDMQIKVDKSNSNNGIGALGAIGIAAAASAVPGGALLYQAMQQTGADKAVIQTVAPAVPGQPQQPGKAEFDILFYDKDGNQIAVPRHEE